MVGLSSPVSVEATTTGHHSRGREMHDTRVQYPYFVQYLIPAMKYSIH